MRNFCLALFALLFLPRACLALDMEDRLDLERILSRVMTTNSNEDNIVIREPKDAASAREIIDRALWLAGWDNEWQVKEDSGKDKDGTTIYPLKVRKEFVDDAICRNFGFEARDYPLLSGKGRKDFDGRFYRLGAGDGGMTARINTARELENGLLKIKGEYAFDMGGEGDFTAFFAPTQCGGFKHWGLRKIVYDNFPEER